ncbi:RNA-dependent RNA polymerase [Wuchang romanomermis nematode virus 2]|uniref:RNA-directed RNA polymerase L n=1 Tax=Wuchang romanomermis nematode virus 2 TaxID=2773460 RepID=A0A1L3KN23_9MONO|nr:RNA-dependent RNA polymerase [Wuchang romanomermis nematode virus 2]APG78782.1 RNA-dependent RNA polymerase [Wuchang romanomermis nematode virus 2]
MDEFEVDSVRVPLLPDSHLQDPILPHKRQLLLAAINGEKALPVWLVKTAQNVLNMLDVNTSRHFIIDSEKYYPLFWTGGRSPVTDAIKAIQIAQMVTRQQLQVIYPDMVAWENVVDKLQVSDDLLYTVQSKLDVEALRDKMQRKARNSNNFPEICDGPCDSRWIITREFAIMKTNDGLVCFDYSQICGLTDTAASRMMSLFLAHVGTQVYTVTLLPTVSTIQDIYGWGDALLTTYGNKSYKILKLFEPLVLAVLINKYDRLPGRTKFFNAILEKFSNAEKELQMPCVSKILVQILERDLNPSQLSELLGIYRHWMHPTVDELNGCLEIQKAGKSQPELHLSTMQKIIAAFNREFVLNYIKKHGVWPQLSFPEELAHSIIYKWWKDKRIKIEEFAVNYNYTDWYFAKFEKTLTFDFHVDPTDILDDKAISVGRKYWDSVYDPYLLGYVPEKAPTSRRVLLEYLSRFEFNTEEIIKMICLRQVSHDHFVVGLRSKERELKLNPREFAMMVLEMRCYFCVTEKNLAEKVLPYFPQQTMTLSEAELTERLLTLTGESSRKSQMLAVKVNLDLSKWNLTWRNITTDGVFGNLDDLFDLGGCYTFTHEFFEKAKIYLVSRWFPPKGLTSQNKDSYVGDTVWENHLGGFEGLRQKGWTIITIAVLIYVELETGISGIITGQGDNQIIIAYFPIPEQYNTADKYLETEPDAIKKAVDDYINFIARTFHEIGLELKAEETWASLDIFAYGKDIISQGAFMPMTIKRVARILTDVNDVYPTLENKLATIHTAGQAAASKGVDVIIPYFIATSECAYAILREFQYSLLLNSSIVTDSGTRLSNLSTAFLQSILLLPRSLGGYPLLMITDYLYRGHPDPITGHIFLLKNLSFQIPWQMVGALLKKGWKAPIDFSMLIQDPTAINWQLPPLGSNIIKNLLNEKIRDISRNRDVNLLFHIESDVEDSKLIEILASMQPFHPRVANDIYRCSPTGARLGFIATFTNTRSIKEMCEKSGSTIFGKIMNAERIWINHIEFLYINRVPHKTLECSYAIAQEWRNMSWFPNKEKSVEGVTTPFPLEQMKINCTDTTRCYLCVDHKEHLVLFNEGSLNKFTTRGPFFPQVGSKTREKSTSKMLALSKTDSAAKAALRISKVRRWVSTAGSNLDKLLEHIVMTRTSIDPTLLLNACGGIFGGNITHRYADVVSPHTALINMRPNHPSFVCYSSDKMGRFSRGGENYTIHFQGIYLAMQAKLALIELFFGCEKLCHYYHIHIACPSCVVKLSEDKLEVSISTLPFQIRNDCKILYSKIEDQLDTAMVVEHYYIKAFSPFETPPSLRRSIAAYAIVSLTLSRLRHEELSKVHARRSLLETRAHTDISIGDVQAIGFVPIFKAFVSAVICYTFPALIEILDQVSSIESAMIILIEMLPSFWWDDLRPLLPFSEVQVEFRQAFPDIIFSPDMVRGTLLADYQLKRLTLSRITCLLNRNDLKWTKTLNFVHKNEHWINAILSWATTLLFAYVTQYPYHHHVRTAYTKIQNILSKASFDLSIPAIQQLLVKITTILSCLPCFTDLLRKDDLASICISYNAQEEWIAACRIYEYQRMSYNNPCETVLIYPILIPYKSILFFQHITDDIWEKSPEITCESRIEIKTRSDHMFRRYGVYSTAPYKYYPLLQSVKSVTRAICLAEGEGGICRLIGKLFPQSMIYYLSLHHPSEAAPQRFASYYPAEIVNAGLEKRIYGLEESIAGLNDLTDPRVVSKVISWNADVDIITSDAEISGHLPIETTMLIFKSVMQIASAVLTATGTVIMKTYCQYPMLLQSLVYYAQRIFHTVELSVSISSSNESTEVFLKLCRIVDRNFWTKITSQPKAPQGRIALRADIEKLCVERKSHYPIQINYKKYIESLDVLLSNLRFEENFETAWNALTHGFLQGFDKYITNSKQFFDESLDLISLMAFKLLQGYGKALTGQRNSRVQQLLQTKTSQIGNQLKYWNEIRHNLILIFILTNRKNLTLLVVKEVLSECLSEVDYLYDRQDLLYTWAAIPVEDWLKRNARHLFHILPKITDRWKFFNY